MLPSSPISSDEFRFLVVEDDLNKLHRIIEFIKARYPDSPIIERRSYQSGLKAALLEEPDCILLDMTMPTYEGGGDEGSGRERRYAGEQILRFLQRKEANCSVIIVTMFERFGDDQHQITIDQLKLRLEKEFVGLYVGTVFYQAAGTAWMDELAAMIDLILSSKGNA